MAFNWANVLVAPTGSSGLTSGNHTAVDEPPPWSDVDEAYIQLGSLASGTFIFNGFNLSLAGGEKKGFWIHWRCDSNAAEGFNVTITVKQGTTTLWTSAQFAVVQGVVKRTYQIRIPDSAFSGNPNIDNMSIEFAAVNLRANNQRLRTSWLALSKSPFTTAQQAVLPSSLTGQDFTCYRADDIGVLGGADAETLFMLPDASGNGRHAILRVSGATYETDAPSGILASTGRFVGSLGYNPATGAVITWTGNKVFHFKLYPTSIAAESAIFSRANDVDFISGAVGQKHILGLLTSGAWVLMSGDGSGPAHLSGGSIATSVQQRITEWVQVGGGNEHMWEEDDVSPVIDGSSGDNPFYSWSLLDRESDDRSFTGRLMEVWFVEGTGVTEAEIDIARGEWVGGADITGTIAVTQTSQTATFTGAAAGAGSIAVTQANQTSTISGVVSIVGTVNVVQTNQTPTITGNVFVNVTGTIAVTQAGQTMTAAGASVTPGNTFTPPARSQDVWGHRNVLLRRYTFPQYPTVLITGGVVSEVFGPHMTQVEAADLGSGYGGRAVFLGGRSWTVTDGEKTILQTAGYTVS